MRSEAPARVLALACAVAFAAAHGSARAAEGGAPPPLDGAREWIGPPLCWGEARGKVVVLALVEPGVSASQDALADVADMLATDAKNGLVGVFVTQASRAEAEAWLARAKPRPSVTVAIDDGSIRGFFATTVAPFGCVVDRDGRVVFAGPWARRIEIAEAVRGALERPRTVRRSATSERLAPVWKAIDAGDLPGAIAALKALRDAGEDARDRDDAHWLLRKIELDAKKAQAAADALFREHAYLDAVEAYEAIAAKYAGLAAAEAAAEAARTMRGDRKMKREIEAGAAIREARALEAAGKIKDAISKYRAAAARWKGTKSAEVAKKRAEELERKKP